MPKSRTEAGKRLRRQDFGIFFFRLMSEIRIDPQADACFQKILKATETTDYALFSSVLSDKMQALIPQPAFEGTCQRMSYFFGVPYRSHYMGELRSGTQIVYFWKLTSEGKSDDILARMSLRDGQISGVLFTPPFDSVLKSRPTA